MAHGGVVELKARSGHPRDGLRGMERRVGSVARLVPRRAMGARDWLSGPRHPIEKRHSGIRRCNDLAPPGGFSFYYDDPNQKVRIVAFFDRCAHLCCPPGWHVITDTRPYRDYLVPSPTYSVYNQDPIFCVCHGSQYAPLLLTTNVHPRNGTRYLGARHVHGPTQRALPVVPFRVENKILVGGMPDPRWYDYC